jgi:TnpA family transposase
MADSPLLAYPEFPKAMTPKRLAQLFRPTPDELRWVQERCKSPPARLGLLCLLKCFPVLGRLAAPEEIPTPVVEYLARCAGLDGLTLADYPRRTRVRHHIEVRAYLEIEPWGAAAQALATQTMERIVSGRAHLSDLINGAIEALVAANFALPALSALRRLAGRVHTRATSVWLTEIAARMPESTLQRLEELLTVSPEATESAFAKLCRPPKRASRNNLVEVLEHLGWLNTLRLPEGLLATLPPNRIDAWAEEARRLTATELREYVAPRRHALLACLLARSRASRLDDLVTILVRFIGRIEARARADLEAWHNKRRMTVTMLVNVLRDLAIARRDAADPAQFALRTDAILTRAGDVDSIVAACDEHLAKGPDDWRQFLEPHFREQRSWLFRLVEALPLAAVGPAYGIVDALIDLKATRERPSEFLKAEFDDQYLDPKWPIVRVPDEAQVYHHRSLEVATFFELLDGLKGGDIYIRGAADYGAFTDDIFPVDSEPAAVAQYLRDRGLPATAKEFVAGLRRDLERGVINFELAVSRDQTVVLGPDNKPIAPRPKGIRPPRSAKELAQTIQDRMPNRTVLEALFNVDQWSGFTRHFGPPSRLSSQLEDPETRSVLTTFAYGCGLGANQAARHFDEPVSPHLLSFVHRRHMGANSLRSAIGDVLDQYAKFELPTAWGPSDKVAADGSSMATYEDNIQASYHLRHGKTGGVAYRHVGTNYVAYFTHFIASGAHEGAYLFDGLQKTESVLKATGVYSDTHGQSAVGFGLAHFLGVELLPRIRNWKHLVLYRPDMVLGLARTAHLYGGTIDWDLIESHWKDFLRFALAIQTGRVTASWVLTRLNSYSRRNKIFRAFRELGRVFRTLYLLRWIEDHELRRAVTHEANKAEHYHDFAAHLNFGSHGVLRTNSRVDQEKAVIANQLVANAVILQTVADQTRIIQDLKREGYPFNICDAKHLSPYLTRQILRFGKFPVRCKAELFPDNVSLDP